MKKTVAIFLSLILLLCLAGCGNNADNAKDNSVLINAVESGKIPEMDIVIGQAVDSVPVKEDHSHQDTEASGYAFVDTGEHPYFLNETAFAFYNSNKKTDGIAAVMSIKEAFGLSCNSYVTGEDIRNTFSGIEFSEEAVDSTDLTIMPFMLETTKKLVFKNGSREIRFYIMDDQLISVCMIDLAIW